MNLITDQNTTIVKHHTHFFLFRDVVKEERTLNSKSMDPKYLKPYSSEGKLPDQLSRSLVDEVGVGPRSYSCSSKAFTFSTGKIRDVSLHGVRMQLIPVHLHCTCTCMLVFSEQSVMEHSSCLIAFLHTEVCAVKLVGTNLFTNHSDSACVV